MIDRKFEFGFQLLAVSLIHIKKKSINVLLLNSVYNVVDGDAKKSGLTMPTGSPEKYIPYIPATRTCKPAAQNDRLLQQANGAPNTPPGTPCTMDSSSVGARQYMTGRNQYRAAGVLAGGRRCRHRSEAAAVASRRQRANYRKM